jgi:hypothetical protein
MAIQIPIVSEFDGKGISKAVQEFKQLEGAGKKAQFAIKKAAVPAAAALGGLAVLLGDATKGAIEDAAAQKELARQLGISTGATDKQIAAVEDWIGTQGRLLGVADDELRPALASLSRVTYDVEEAQKAATLAMDIAAATGKPLETVTNALAKAYGGNTAALAKLDPSLRDMIKGGATLDEVFYALGGTFGGAAQEAANTAEGGFKRLSLSLSETKESIGAALLPMVEKALPKLQEFASWAQNNPEIFTKVALAIGGIAAATVAVNAAMATNPYVLMAGGIIALSIAFDRLATAAEKFNKVGGLAVRLLGAAAKIPQMGVLDRFILNKIRGSDDNIGPTGGGLAVPAMATGGIVTSPTLALIGEAGPEAVVPLSKMGGMGGGINITVTSADPRAVVDALVRYSRQNGSLPPDVRVA